MPNVLCPSCGHTFKAVKCQCRGNIVSAQAWELGRWDWRPLFGSFGRNVRPMDVDAIVENRGRFLVFETKPPSVETLPVGQMRLLQELARLPQFTVGIIRGEPDDPQDLEVLGPRGFRRPITYNDLWTYAAEWWTRVDRMRGTG